MIAYLGIASVLETGCGIAIAILVGSAAFATLGAALGAPEEPPTMWRRGERRVGTFQHTASLALERIGIAEALAAVETWRLEKE